MMSFIQRYAGKIIGQMSGWDRLRFRGTLRMLAHAAGLSRFLGYKGVLLKDFGRYAQEVSERTREASLEAARAAGREVVYVRDSQASKEDLAREIQARDGIKEGLICVLTAVENCGSYQVRGNRQTHLLELRHERRKCLHLYHYYQHPEFGLMHVRLQSWLPLTLFIGLNGREWLSRQMDRAGIGYLRRDNCFAGVSDVAGAQELLHQQVRWDWNAALGALARQVNPALPQVVGDYAVDYYWSLEESEWATDVMFKDGRELSRLYEPLIRHGMEHLGSRDVLRFLGHKVPAQGIAPRLALEVTSDLKARPEGIRLKHRVGANAVKMYNKQESVLRFETTLNNMREMKAPRREGGKVVYRRMRKGVGDIVRRAAVSQATNNRYMQAMAAAEETTPLKELTADLTRPVVQGGRRARGLNPLGEKDARLLGIVSDGKYLITGFRNRDVQAAWFQGPARDAAEQRRRSGQVSRLLWLLRAHGLIKKTGGTYRYQVTSRGRQIIAAIQAARAANTVKLARAA
jgi:hypothetical protein